MTPRGGKERPILFSGPMVRALLKGRKTQTRRLVKPQPPTVESVVALSGSDYSWFTDEHSPGRFRVAGPVWAVRDKLGFKPEIVCPYGVPGDRLWVRETWATEVGLNTVRPCHLDETETVFYHADDSHRGPLTDREGRWRPGIHMPRWASRITLEVTDVRAQRLWEVDDADSVAEGVADRDCFRALWDSINGDRAEWTTNPWVWAISFRHTVTT